MPTLTLTDRTIAGLKAAERQIDYFDRTFPGFGVRVGATGRKTFQLVTRVNGKARRFTIRDPETDKATYPDLKLARARDLAREALKQSGAGRDPAAERKEAQARTFEKLAELYLEQHAQRKKRSWREDARIIRAELEAWTDRPVVSIRRADVRDLLEAIVQRGAPVMANRTLSLVTTMFNIGVDREWLEANPAARMAKPGAEESRTRVLVAEEIRQVWKWLRRPPPSDDADPQHWTLAQAVLKLRLITAQRGGEVVNMRWADVDLKAGWWTIPAEHAKNKLPHRVPLTAMAVKILKPLRRRASKDTVYTFEGIRGARHRRGLLDGLPVADVRPHDFRRTAASLMAAGGVPRLTIAKILNHVDATVTAIYDRHSYDPEKQAALAWWDAKLAAIVTNHAGKVLPFVIRSA